MDRVPFERFLTHRANRRRLLATGLGLATAISLPGRATRLAGAQEATPAASPVAGSTFTAYPFSLGVASGDSLPDGVVLWTRLAPDPLADDGLGGLTGLGPFEVTWEVAEDETFGAVVQSGTTTANADFGFSVHADVTGLSPAREYFYRFMVGSEVSPIGRTKTAPAAGAAVDRLRFAFASCQHYEDGFYTAYRFMAQEDLDLILHLGDYIYEYGDSGEEAVAAGEVVRRHTGDEIVTLSDYRNRFALYKTDADLQAAHQIAPWVVTWDDHEVDNDYANAMSEEGWPVETFLERRAAAYQAYYEHMPLRVESMPRGAAMQLYRSLTYGTLTEFQVLDTRQYRTDHPCGDGAQVRCPASWDPSTTMLGPEQEQWLLANLDASGATWNVLAQSLQMAEMEQQPGLGEVYWNDSWPGYPAARNRILSHIMSRGISNPVVITGDIHCHWANDLKADWQDPASPTIGTEFIGTSISSEGDGISDFFTAYLPENPHIKFFDGRHGGYVSVEVTPETWRSDFKQLASVTTPDAPIETIASYVTENGNPGVVPA